MSAPLICCLPLLLIMVSIHATQARVEMKLPESLSVSDFAIDRAGDIYVCGSTENRTALGTNITGLGRARVGIKPVVLKLSASGGQIVSGVVLNSHAGTELHRITISESGKVVVTGITQAQEGGMATRGLIVLQFDSTCRRLLWSTVLPAGAGDTINARAVQTDGEDNVFVGGSIYGSFAGAQVIGPSVVYSYFPGFVAGISADGSVRFVTLFGGSTGAEVEALAVTPSGELIAGGTTASDSFPGATGAAPPPRLGNGLDAFLVRFSPDGKALTRSLLLGGEGDDRIHALTIDSTGQLHAGGSTSSSEWLGSNFEPSATGGRYSGFVLRVDTAGTNIVSSRAIRVTGADAITELHRNGDGVLHIAGAGGNRYQPGYSPYWFYYPELFDEGFHTEPFVAVETAETTVRTALLNACEARSAYYAEVRLGFGGKAYVLSRDVTLKKAAIRVSRVSSEIENAPNRRLLLLSPPPGRIANTNEPITLRARVTGENAPGMVATVRFYDGGRLIGTATNFPYEVTVGNWKRGLHLLSAATDVDGVAIRSCTVPLRVSRASPRNDTFANRTAVSGERVTVRGSFAGATAEPITIIEEFETWISSYTISDPDVWWTWTAPRSGVFRITVSSGSKVAYAVNVFTGSVLTNMQDVSGSLISASATVRAVAGVNYHLRIGGFTNYRVPYKLTIRPVTPPENDDFADATPISGAPVEVMAILDHASSEPGEQNAVGRNVWYSWTAEKAGCYIATVQGTSYWNTVAVYGGSAVASLERRSSTLVGGSLRGVAFEAMAGEQLHIAVSSWEDAETVLLRIDELSAPSNDNFRDAFLLGEPPMTTGTALGATVEAGEPPASGGSVWWTWRAPASKPYRVTLKPTVPSGPTNPGLAAAPRSPLDNGVIGVYSGSAVAVLTQIASSSYGIPAEVTFRADAGELYYVRVASPGLGLFELDVHPVNVPPNDGFLNVTDLVGEAGVRGTTHGASIEAGEPSHGGFFSTADSSVWYGWRAPSKGVFAFELLGRPAMDIYQGETLLTLVKRPAGTDRFVFSAESGENFYVAVYSSWEEVERDFTLRVNVVTPPSNDDFIGRIQLEGVDVRASANGRNATGGDGEPSNSRTLWWSWTAPTGGTYALECSYAVNANVFAGDSVEALQLVASDSERLTFNAVAGITYALRLDLTFYAYDRVDLHLYSAARPVNDEFEHATPITSAEFTVSTWNAGATAQAGEPMVGNREPVRSLWWAWTPPQDALVLVSAIGSNSSPVLALYAGSALHDLQPLRSDNPSTVMQVHSNQTYWISVDDSYSFGFVTVSTTVIAPPENDTFVNRRRIGEERVRGTFTGATTEAREMASQYGTNASTVWFVWRSSTPAAFMLESGSLSFGFYPIWYPVDVFTGDTLEGLVSVFSSEYRAEELGREPRGYFDSTYKLFMAEGDRDYAIRVTAPEGAVSDYDFMVTSFQFPANDDFAGRAAMGPLARFARATNTFATYETGEPAGVDGSVWWSWTAPTSGVYFVSSAKSAVPAVADVYAGGELGELTPVSSAWARTAGDVVFRAEGGMRYSIRVGSPVSGRRGVVAIEIGPAQAPANDDFARRSALLFPAIIAPSREPLTVSVSGSNYDATVEPGEPLTNELSTVMSRQSVWWSWTPPQSGRATIEVAGTNGGYTVAVFKGDALTNLQVVATNLYYTTPLVFDAAAGTSYSVRVAGACSPPGFFTLKLNLDRWIIGPPFPPIAPATELSRPTLRIPTGQRLYDDAILETSTNLSLWTPANSFMLTSNAIVVPSTGEPARFFRWKRP